MEVFLYKRHPVYAHLFCGDNGEVWTSKRKRFIKTKPDAHGYLCTNINGKITKIHRLICQTFYGITYGLDVNHINGIKTDNSLSNLEWSSRRDNLIHAFKIGLQNNKGHNAPRCKVTPDDVIQIRKMKKDSIPTIEIAKKFSISKATVNRINKKDYETR